MRLPDKEVTCKCGGTNVISVKSDWCQKCGNKIFYHEKDQKKHKFSVLYTYLVVFGVIFFLTFIFVEMLLVPSLNL